MLQQEQLKSKLLDYMSTIRLSGYESRMAYKFKGDLSAYADQVKIDKMGNVIGTIEGTDSEAPSVMVFAHMDVIGFVISCIEPDGFLRFDRVGGISEKIVQGKAVVVGSEMGEYYPGIIAAKSYHGQTPEDKSKVDSFNSLFVDIGARSVKEVNDLGIFVGCPITFAPYYAELLNDRIAGAYLDDATGLTNLLQIAAVLSDDRPRCTVHLVGTVMEEFNARGAMMAARTVKTDMAICLLSPGAGDTPDQKSVNNIVLGGGPGVTMFNFHGKGTLNGNIVHQGMYQLLKKTAEEQGIPLQRCAARGALSDTAYLQLENEGIPCLDMGTPDRYSHSPMEICDLKDLEMVGLLVAAFLNSVDRNFNLNRY
ncbi:Putative aminopeptidase FrvX [Fontibacillus panacisegetis]|uniref:Putative aminopeptidase FrvX n=1 Tax=Fontibacillus panacisegetis TaxID=670482 RepID=A0A1G7QMD4_9BACL|nr:M20/M25/M40 family metallo-hydrolase [Fontibacillus panacisegetis]SDF99069.1 Putative aminopeptidase FrvX [Fontibacillus panacisegetis]